jgi:hypothetical protein
MIRLQGSINKLLMQAFAEESKSKLLQAHGHFLSGRHGDGGRNAFPSARHPAADPLTFLFVTLRLRLRHRRASLKIRYRRFLKA